jgi:hypothetical protein
MEGLLRTMQSGFRLDPVKEGLLKAARLLTERGKPWSKVCQRFAEAPLVILGTGAAVFFAVPLKLKGEIACYPVNIWYLYLI